jgi:hypothetical protein
LLALAGQSNAAYIRKFLEERAHVVGFADVTPIVPCWSDVEPVAKDEQGRAPNDGICWQRLKPSLTPDLDAFVWWQGEVDDVGSRYGEKLADLMRRVRAEARSPRLLVVVIQLGPNSGDDPEGPAQEGLRWAQQDANAIYVQTRDFEYQPDRTHMTDQGYRDVSARIVAAVRAKLGR